jgi:hypothetical protein
VTESEEVDVVSDEIRRWSSLSEGVCPRFVSAEDGILNEFEMMWQLCILFPLHFLVFQQIVCHLSVEDKLAHKPSVKEHSDQDSDTDG